MGPSFVRAVLHLRPPGHIPTVVELEVGPAVSAVPRNAVQDRCVSLAQDLDLSCVGRILRVGTFIGREVQEPVTPTEALSATRARQLTSLPEGESALACRDRALLKFYLYTGARIGTGCRLKVENFIDDDEDPKVRIQEKGRGKSKRALGINVVAADALREYIAAAGLTSGPLFRPRVSSRSDKLAERAMDVSTMYRLVQGYLERLPRSMQEVELQDGEKGARCIYSPHSLRASTATLLLDAGKDIREVQKLLGHKHVTVTQVYDKRRRGTKDSASHRLSL